MMLKFLRNPEARSLERPEVARRNSELDNKRQLLFQTKCRESKDLNEILEELYGSSPKRHLAPTLRLIAQKNSASDHKGSVSDRRTQNYGIHYTSCPGLSYCVEPLHGEINYKTARKNPLKFYESIIKQEVLLHKVKGVGSGQKISSEVTKRKIGKIPGQVESKLCELLVAKSQIKQADVSAAMKAPQVKTTANKYLDEKSIEVS